MNKKIVGIIGILVIVLVVGFGAYFLLNDKGLNRDNENEPKETVTDKNTQDEGQTSDEKDKTGNSKVLVVYFSATNNTKSVAEKIAKNLDGDLFEIEPEDEYTSDDLNYTNEKSRVSLEHDDEKLRNVKLKKTSVENWEEYDTVLIGYPIWWQVAAWPVNTFVEANDFTGKTVIPFATSASSGLGQSGKLLEDMAKGGNWLEGKRFSSRPSDNDIKDFTDQIK